METGQLVHLLDQRALQCDDVMDLIHALQEYEEADLRQKNGLNANDWFNADTAMDILAHLEEQDPNAFEEYVSFTMKTANLKKVSGWGKSSDPFIVVQREVTSLLDFSFHPFLPMLVSFFSLVLRSVCSDLTFGRMWHQPKCRRKLVILPSTR